VKRSGLLPAATQSLSCSPVSESKKVLAVAVSGESKSHGTKTAESTKQFCSHSSSSIRWRKQSDNLSPPGAGVLRDLCQHPGRDSRRIPQRRLCHFLVPGRLDEFSDDGCGAPGVIRLQIRSHSLFHQ
jgi:hypothetical protein